MSVEAIRSAYQSLGAGDVEPLVALISSFRATRAVDAAHRGFGGFAPESLGGRRIVSGSETM